MTLHSRSLSRLAPAFVALAFTAGAHAEHTRQVGDVVVNIGVVSARALADDPAERASHGDALLGSAQHVVVSLADATGRKSAPAAAVAVRVVDPKGRIEERQLVAGAPYGVPDYSGLFRFGWSGPYRLEVRVVPEGSKPPVVADFTWTHHVR